MTRATPWTTHSKLLLLLLLLLLRVCVGAALCVCRYWWFSATGSSQRQKVNFAVDGILVGPLLGKAVTVIGNQAAPGGVHYACMHTNLG
jgi:hypothetical protein